MPPSFFRAFVRPLALALAGVLAVGLVLGWHPRDDSGSDPAYDAIVKAHSRRKAELVRAADSLAALATSAETVYVATRRTAHALVAELPRVETAGDTIVLTEGRFVAPRPVVALVVRQARVIAVQDSALADADRLLALKDQQLAVADSGRAVSDSLAALYQAQIPKPPSRLSRVWDRVKLPLLFTAGVYVGAKVTR